MIMHEYIILLGSNIDPANNLKRAKAILGCITTIKKTSNIFKTTSIRKGDSPFLNQALCIETPLDKNELKAEMLEIEQQLGRVRHEDAYVPITIDMDIYLEDASWSKEALADLKYEALLVALVDLMPEKLLPNGLTLKAHYQNIKQQRRRLCKPVAKTVLITGASKRIGRYLALAFAHQGYNIIAHYHTSTEEALVLKKRIQSLGQTCVLWQCDFGAPNASLDVIQTHKIDLLINSAATFFSNEDVAQDPGLLERQWQTNFMVPKKLIEDFIQYQSGGHIINLLDNEIARNYSAHHQYLTTKKLLHCLGIQKAAQYRPQFRVNAIAPGWILDPVHQLSADAYIRTQQKIKSKKLPRKGDVADLMNAALFLEMNDYINGQVIYLDGGRHC